VFAKDFGKQGTTFEIKEEGFVSMMQRRLSSINLAEHEKMMEDIASKKVEEPTAVEGITRAEKTISHSFDPSYVLDADVFLPCGKLLYAAGTTVNPLDHMAWSGRIVFIDARDKAQVVWVKENYLKSKLASNESVSNEEESSQKLASQHEKDSEKIVKIKDGDDTKIILVGGRPLELEKETNSLIYFDQFGELTKKFNIAHVPATVEQDGKYLKVIEVNIEE
jgi:conjugal transfer pilus assembly protein TraW